MAGSSRSSPAMTGLKADHFGGWYKTWMAGPSPRHDGAAPGGSGGRLTRPAVIPQYSRAADQNIGRGAVLAKRSGMDYAGSELRITYQYAGAKDRM